MSHFSLGVRCPGLDIGVVWTERYFISVPKWRIKTSHYESWREIIKCKSNLSPISLKKKKHLYYICSLPRKEVRHCIYSYSSGMTTRKRQKVDQTSSHNVDSKLAFSLTTCLIYFSQSLIRSKWKYRLLCELETKYGLFQIWTTHVYWQ